MADHQSTSEQNPGSAPHRVPENPIPIGPRRYFPKHVQLDLSSRPERPWGPGTNSYLRSYSQSSFRSPARSRRSSGFASPAVGTPRGSVSTVSLQQLIERLELNQYDTYGVEELRGGFFDASFFRPLDKVKAESERIGLLSSGAQDKPSSALALHLLNLVSSIYDFILLFKTQQGIHIIKSFLSYYLAYIICLIPTTQQWLGRHSYFATISVLFNHSGRTFGAQIDGFILCITGAAIGLAWGCLALELSNTPGIAEPGLKGVVAVLLILFSVIIAWLRSSLVRLYQAVMSAGLAVYYLCLLEPNEPEWNTRRIWEFGMPWLAGQVICLIVNVIVKPGAGGKEIVVALNQALLSALDVLVLPRAVSPECHQELNKNLVALSEAVRDMRSEIIITSFKPDDVEQLRNILQGMMRDLMAINTETTLFDISESPFTEILEEEESESPDEPGIELAYRPRNSNGQNQTNVLIGMDLVREVLSTPTRDLINTMTDTITSCNDALMEMSGYREFSISSPSTIDGGALVSNQNRLESAMDTFDEADVSLIDHPMLPSSYSQHPDLVKLFLFIHPVRQAADSICALATKVRSITSSPSSKKLKVFLPNYPWKRALNRSNPQVRHDRGGMTAGYYFRSKKLIDEVIGKAAARNFVLDTKLKEQDGEKPNNTNRGTQHMNLNEEGTMRHRIWRVLHRMQQFEGRFAFKFALITSLLALPGYLEDHKGWYFKNEGWWAVAAAWFTMHPRVGGNAQDLITRSFLAVLGAIWGGLAFGARSGNPYVMAVFAFIFMLPAIIRLTQSSHPRSGLMACVSFSLVSLTAYNLRGVEASPVQIAWARGTAIVVGIFAAVFINWCLWPFVARHELRKSISSMMLNLAISYRGIVTRYIYHDQGAEPSEEDIRISQIQESRLREGFFRIRELLGMTRHEIRLRGPFDPTPYISLVDTCERFFEHLVEVRQSSLYFQPFSLVGEPEYNKALLSVRRDAVASIIMNLTTLSGALREKAPIPKYLPSAAVARKRLLDRMAEIESAMEAKGERVRQKPEKSRRWADVYQYAYSTALTDIVGQLEQLEVLVKEIVGEMALDAPNI